MKHPLNKRLVTFITRLVNRSQGLGNGTFTTPGSIGPIFRVIFNETPDKLIEP